MMRIDRTMKTFRTAKFLPFQTLNHFSFKILKRMVFKSNNSLCYGMQDWSTLSSSVFSGQTKTWSLMRQVASFSQTFPKTFFGKHHFLYSIGVLKRSSFKRNNREKSDTLCQIETRLHRRSGDFPSIFTQKAEEPNFYIVVKRSST